MIVITDCLTSKVDEGTLKVANSLLKRIKKKYPETTIISYGERTSSLSDLHMNLNKLFLNKELFKLIRSKNEDVLFIPFTSNTKGNILRTIMLSLYSKKPLKVIYTMKQNMPSLVIKLLKLNEPHIYSLSKESYDYFKECDFKNVTYLKTGVDTSQFVPVSSNKKKELRHKYNISESDIIALHVGHLKRDRNVEMLTKLPHYVKPYLVTSSTFVHEEGLKESLINNGVTIIDTYIENIEEIYQICDFYFFPVVKVSNCIDIPLSVLEAASCNLPVLTTRYGELKSFVNEEAFFFIDDFNIDELNVLTREILSLPSIKNDIAVKSYDWNHAIDMIVD